MIYLVCFNNFADERLSDAVVRVGHDSEIVNNPVFGIVSMDQIRASQKIELTCCRRGNFISVNFPSSKREYLHICEVKAYSSGERIRSKDLYSIFVSLAVLKVTLVSYNSSRHIYKILRFGLITNFPFHKINLL